MRKSGTSGKERKQGLFPSCFPDFQIISCLREEGLLGQAGFNLGKSNRISNIQQGTPNFHRTPEKEGQKFLVLSFELGEGIAIEIETAPCELNKEIRNIRKREETGAISFLLS